LKNGETKYLKLEKKGQVTVTTWRFKDFNLEQKKNRIQKIRKGRKTQINGEKKLRKKTL